jgi:putative protease
MGLLPPQTVPAVVAPVRHRLPEVLAPAGDHDTMAAALAAGADAVYFGLDDGFNARARATNFPSGSLAEVVAWIHRAGVRAYVTLNTLVFEPELPIVEELLRRVAAAGTDAIIVQDPAVALLARAICPALDVHASTQMTASSPLAASGSRPGPRAGRRAARALVDEIRRYAAGTQLHWRSSSTALCVAWAGIACPPRPGRPVGDAASAPRPAACRTS